MGNKKGYEEKQRHGTVELPVGLHKMEYPEGTDAIFYLHWHQEFEFLVLTKGEILFTIEEREYILHPGDCVFINSNLLHSAKTLGGQPCSFFAVDFSYEALEDDMHSRFAKKYILPVLQGKYEFQEFLPVEGEDYSHPELAAARDGIVEIDGFIDRFSDRKHMPWQREVIWYLAQIGQCPEHKLAPHELLIRSRLLCVWNLMYAQGRAVKKNQMEEHTTSERLRPVIDYIKKNYAYEISLMELAELLPMSEGQFCRVFKQHMKISPMQYLMRYRILQSCRLLQDTDKKIGEIANLTGFNNISYFNKVFMKIIGCTPKEYRSNVNY